MTQLNHIETADERHYQTPTFDPRSAFARTLRGGEMARQERRQMPRSSRTVTAGATKLLAQLQAVTSTVVSALLRISGRWSLWTWQLHSPREGLPEPWRVSALESIRS